MHGVVRTSGIPREKAAQRKINTLEWATVAAEVANRSCRKQRQRGAGLSGCLHV